MKWYLKVLDINESQLIILFYFVLIVSIGGITGLRRTNKSSDGFFLAGHSMNWVVIGAALFAANIFTTHMVGLVTQGFRDGSHF